jgi:glycosyltransferase involved in cell wall biosynthesis
MNLHNQPLVSVLTPVYNGETSLTKAIESVLNQRYQHWEYVIINNCSTDGTLELAQNYAKQDSRIRIHTNTDFVGLIANHNIAFGQMSPASRYCKVLHADDALLPNCLEEMVALAEANPSVALISAYRVSSAGVDLTGLPYPTSVFPGRLVARRMLLEGLHVTGSPSATMLRAELVRQRMPFFDEADLHADTHACLGLLRDHDVGFVHQILTYNGRSAERATSTTASRFNTFRISNINDLLVHGPVFLTPEEYRTRLAAVVGQYYAYLGECKLQRRDEAFWQHQEDMLARISMSLNRGRVQRAAAAALLERLLNPKRTVENIVHKLRQRRRNKRSGSQPVSKNVLS